jgi:hypothetical protein
MRFSVVQIRQMSQAPTHRLLAHWGKEYSGPNNSDAKLSQNKI